MRDDDAAALVVRRLNEAQRAGLETRIGDVSAPSTLPAAMSGIDAVLHLAAIPRDFDGGQSLRLVNTEGTRNVVHAARDGRASGGSSTRAPSPSSTSRTSTTRAPRRRR